MAALALTSLALAALLLSACADFARGRPTTGGGDDDNEPPVTAPDGGMGALSYAADVHDLVVADCRTCHQMGGAAQGTGYLLSGDPELDYPVHVRFVDESDPASSRLVTKAAGMGHQGGALYPAGSDENALLLSWIRDGALP